MKISFANSIGDLAMECGAEPEKILAAIGSDSRIGIKYLKYGFGFGGPCFPRDNQALNKFASDVFKPLLLSEATIKVNQDHLDHQFNQILKSGENPVYIDHVTYKKGTDILEESQQLALALRLAQSGRKVIIRDSRGVREKLEQTYPGLFQFE
jgi:UDP-glucose 6-dehydrogenase